jgi:DNA repair exonuclease SbcCD ATPase subunit
MIMDSKSVLAGILVGLLIGAAGVFFVNQSNISRLNSQISALEDQAESLDEVILIKQNLLDSQQDIIDAVEELEAQADITQAQLDVFKQNADAIIEGLELEVSLLNKLAARQTFRAEDPNYVSEINFLGVYGDLSFEEWWELNESPYTEWMSLVYT